MATPGEVLYFETAPREANAWGNLNHEQREHWEREANHRAADKALTLLRDRTQQAEKREADLLARVSRLEKQTSDDALLTADFSERILKLERTPFNMERIASALETIAKQWPVCPRCNQPVTPSLGIHLCPDGKAP